MDVVTTMNELEKYARFAREDLGRKDYDRLQSELRTIKILTEQVEEHLGTIAGSKVKVVGKKKTTRKRARRVIGEELKAAVLDVLRNAGEPMRVVEIADKLKEKGVDLPGQGKPANLLSHFQRWDEIQRSGYGVYELTPAGTSTTKPGPGPTEEELSKAGPALQ